MSRTRSVDGGWRANQEAGSGIGSILDTIRPPPADNGPHEAGPAEIGDHYPETRP